MYTHTYIQYEALCKEDLCLEEVREAESQQQEEEEVDEQGQSPSQDHSRVQKGQGGQRSHWYRHDKPLPLTDEVSPVAVRRLRINGGNGGEKKRHSATHAELMKVRKNWSGSGTLFSDLGSGGGAVRGGYLRTSESNLSSATPPTGGREEAKKKMVRHSYEDVEVGVGAGPKVEVEVERKGHHTRTMNWIDRHTEMNWGRDQEAREVTGSLWSSRNRQGTREPREGRGRGTSGRSSVGGGRGSGPWEGGKGLKSEQSRVNPSPSYHGSTPLPSSHSSRGVPPPSSRQGNATPPLTRRTSYLSAVGDADVPVRDSTRQRGGGTTRLQAPSREEQFPSPPEYTHGYSSRHGNRDKDGWHMDGPRPHSYVHQHAPQSRVNKYSSLQRDITTPTNPAFTRRGSSESNPLREQGGGRGMDYYQGRESGDPQRPRRTFSNDQTFNSSPPQRGDDNHAPSRLRGDDNHTPSRLRGDDNHTPSRLRGGDNHAPSRLRGDDNHTPSRQRLAPTESYL